MGMVPCKWCGRYYEGSFYGLFCSNRCEAAYDESERKKNARREQEAVEALRARQAAEMDAWKRKIGAFKKELDKKVSSLKAREAGAGSDSVQWRVIGDDYNSVADQISVFRTRAVNDHTDRLYLDLIEKAFAEMEKKCMNDARAAYDKVTSEQDKAWFGKGKAYESREQWDKAIECYTKAITTCLSGQSSEAYTRLSNYYYWRAYCYKKKGDKSRAAADYQKASEFSPGDNNIAVNIAEMGMADQAIATCDKVISRNPADPSVWIYKKDVLAKLKKFDQAVECCNKAIELAPDKVIYYWAKAELYQFEMRNYPKAIAAWKEVLKHFPNDTAAPYRIEQIQDKMSGG